MAEYVHDKETGIQRLSFKNLRPREVNICHDTNYSDVTFVFPPTEGFKLDKPSAAIGDKEKFFAGPTLVAHKVILAQWPYFKLMFESDFAEGGSGHRQVTIKDTSLAVFKVLLRYIYTETVPVDDTVKYVYDNPLNFGNVSWELIFLASDRYDIAGLREEAQRRLITNLCEREVKNFLFRPAYLFHDLRVAAIEYIAKNCGHLFIPSSSRDLFKDHAEYATILGELYETLYNFH
ncbi:hypothetical protein BGZ94_000232, partial [Podila epigama]